MPESLDLHKVRIRCDSVLEFIRAGKFLSKQLGFPLGYGILNTEWFPAYPLICVRDETPGYIWAEADGGKYPSGQLVDFSDFDMTSLRMDERF